MIASALAGLAGAGVFLAWRVPPRSLGASSLLFDAPLVVDRLSAFFLLLLHAVSLMTSWFGARYTEDERVHYPLGAVLPLTAVFVLSMQGVLLASGVAGFLLFWEAMSLSAFLLVMADREEESRRAALLYLAIAQFGAGALIVGCGILGGGSLFATFDTLRLERGHAVAGSVDARDGAGAVRLHVEGRPGAVPRVAARGASAGAEPRVGAHVRA